MAKILTDEEMGQIIYDATRGKIVIDDADTYGYFLKDLAELICSYFGGEHGALGKPDYGLGWTVGFHIDDRVPADGGVFKDYDPGIVWNDGEEEEI